jgi:probable phosphoglycerate mutase
MKFILLRHGETEEEKKGIVLGHLHGTLSDEGKKQAERVAAMIAAANLRPEIILTSDLARALDYAIIIGNELNIKIEQEPLMRERGAGEVEGIASDKINWEEYEKVAKPLRKHVGGESFEDVRVRAKEFLTKIEPLPYQTALLISHSVFLAMLTMEVCGWTMDEALAHDFRDPLVIDGNIPICTSS